MVIGAVTCFGLGTALLSSTGLPERSDFIGLRLQSGQRIAPAVGAIAPAIAAQTLQGDSIQLAQFRGEPVVINFWATWCVPCRMEMPELQRLYEEKKVRVLAVNRTETQATIQAWVNELNLSFDILLDPDGVIAASYWLRDIPSTFIVSPGGIIVQIYFGPVSAEQLYGAVLPFTTS